MLTVAVSHECPPRIIRLFSWWMMMLSHTSNLQYCWTQKKPRHVSKKSQTSFSWRCFVLLTKCKMEHRLDVQNTDTLLSWLAVTLDWIEVAQKTIPADIERGWANDDGWYITDILTSSEKECPSYSLSVGLEIARTKGGNSTNIHGHVQGHVHRQGHKHGHYVYRHVHGHVSMDTDTDTYLHAFVVVFWLLSCDMSTYQHHELWPQPLFRVKIISLTQRNTKWCLTVDFNPGLYCLGQKMLT